MQSLPWLFTRKSHWWLWHWVSEKQTFQVKCPAPSMAPRAHHCFSAGTSALQSLQLALREFPLVASLVGVGSASVLLWKLMPTSRGGLWTVTSVPALAGFGAHALAFSPDGTVLAACATACSPGLNLRGFI